PTDHTLHPALLDAALHPLILNTPQNEQTTQRIPFAWSNITLHATHATTLHAHLTPTTPDTVELALFDADGGPVARIGGLTTRPVSRQQLGAAAGATDESGVHLLEWTLLPPAEDVPAPQSVALLGTADPLELAPVLGGCARYEDLTALGTAVDAGAEAPGLVLVSVAGEGEGTTDVLTATRTVLYGATGLVQEWLSDERFARSRLVVVTRGAVATRPGPEIRDLAAAPVWGLVRSARTENPERFALLDLDTVPAIASATADAVLQVLTEELPEAAVRDGSAHVPRLVRPADAAGVLTPPVGVGSWRVDVTSKGTLGNVALVPHPEGERPLAAHEIRVAMRAGGLNFRDVMIGLGMYPGDDAMIGGEGAGVVLETGSEVTGLSVGDRVFGMFPSGGLGPVGVTDHRLTARIPRGLSFGQASVIPVVYLTAYYGLTDLAGLRAGERLLIHSAAGGVGMA
ncbi:MULTISPECIES: polyketide synthase dehydratase domain-containing protein, partial [unclassified Streptomyces]|uniref:SpnB-like Rossmann fold domain-containing protein n=1 Tax=unclassified Streptomyces TaxID=2593676 RepID=UPI00056C88D1